MRSVIAAFPDGRWTVEDQVAEGDKVVTRWSFLGILRLTSICLVEAWARVQAEQSIWRIRLEAADRAVIRICPHSTPTGAWQSGE
jgi:SnoaL-like polyketide cyclase